MRNAGQHGQFIHHGGHGTGVVFDPVDVSQKPLAAEVMIDVDGEAALKAD